MHALVGGGGLRVLLSRLLYVDIASLKIPQVHRIHAVAVGLPALAGAGGCGPSGAPLPSNNIAESAFCLGLKVAEQLIFYAKMRRNRNILCVPQYWREVRLLLR